MGAQEQKGWGEQDSESRGTGCVSVERMMKVLEAWQDRMVRRLSEEV